MKKANPSTAIPLGGETMPNLQADLALRIQIGSIAFQWGFEPKDFLWWPLKLKISSSQYNSSAPSHPSQT